MNSKYFLPIILIAALGAGCRKYVEIEQTNIRTLKYTSDFRNVMNNNSVLEGTVGYPVLSGDDCEISDPTRQNALGDILGNVYTWGPKYTSETQGDADWEKLYKTIYTCNEVIQGVRDSEGGTGVEKERIYAEGLVHRAYSFLLLVSLYAKPYNLTSAAADPGIPLLTTPNLYSSLKRASVEEVYQRILSDLRISISRLPAIAEYNTRPAKVSAYAIMARTYLNMRDFTKAGLYADSALMLQNKLLDLKNFQSAPSTLPVRLQDPEVILSKTVNAFYQAISISPDLLTAMGPNDLRYELFTKPRSNFGGSFSTAFTGRAYWRYRLVENVILNGPSVPEMIFIKAECLARNGDAVGAMQQVNSLRKNRFTAANYIDLTANDPATALGIVIQEKRKEFLGTGMRWLDQKRLTLDPVFAQSKSRTYKTVVYNLESNSNRYSYPIGDKYILLNPELLQNPR